MNTPAQNRAEIPAPGPFDNGVSFMILMVVVALVGFGVLFMISPRFDISAVGLGMVIVGVIWFITGSKEFIHPKIGMLRIWGYPITIKGKTVVVGGRTILANYFPFFVSAQEIEIKYYDYDIEISVMTLNGVTMKGTLSLSLLIDITDLIDFLRVGSMEEVRRLLDDIAKTRANAEAQKHHSEVLCRNYALVADAVRKGIEERSFGVLVQKCQTVLSLPDKVVDSRNAVEAEVADREAETYEYETNLRAAKALQQAYANDPHNNGNVPTLEACLESIKDQRLIRDGKASGIRGGAIPVKTI